MKRFFSLILVLFLLTAGCTIRHYEVKNEKLHIYLKDPKAEKVYMLCSVDEYKPRQAINTGSGIWETVLSPNIEFKYFFLVDGKVFIPACELKEKDDFGSENCVYTPMLGNP